MGIGSGLAALLALLGAGGVYAADRLGLVGWPPVASRSLLMLFVLAAVTRVAADAGVRAQQHARHAVAGVAATAGAWFLMAALSGAGRPMAALGGLHLFAAWLAAAREATAPVRTRALQLTAVTALAVSLLAYAAMSSSQLAAFLAGIGIVGGALVARGQRAGTVVVGAIALYGTALALRMGRGPNLDFEPLVAITMLIAAAPLLIALWRVIAAVSGLGPRAAIAASGPAGSRSPPAAR